MNTGHGHVTPREDGMKARCGGPALCAECSRELAVKEGKELAQVGGSHSKHVVEIEAQYTGLVVRPGDKLVVSIARRMSMKEEHDAREVISSKLPGVELVIITEATGMVVYRDEEGRAAWQ